MIDHTPLPLEIVLEVASQERIMGWPEYVPAWAFVPDSNGRERSKRWNRLTVADCEQLVEHHTRLARLAIEQWQKNGKQIRKAGKNILYARLYRCQYFTLTGKTDSTELDMPFPVLRDDDIRALIRGDLDEETGE